MNDYNNLTELDLEIFIQPIYYAAPIGEALIRMKKSKNNAEPVFNIIKRNKWQEDLDLFVTEEVCKIIKNNNISYPITLNICPESFEIKHFTKKLDFIVHKYQIQKNLIYIEISENIKSENIEVKKNILNLVQLGYTTVLDDFGLTKYSMDMLKNLDAIQIVKIDKSLIEDITLKENTVSILKNIIAMISDLNKKIIIEGVETKDELNIINSLQDNIGIQGFLLSRPISVDEFSKTLE